MTLAELTKELAAIPSHEDETKAGEFLEEWLATETSATVVRDEVGNVIARKGSGPELALVGHHDVVPPDPGQLDENGQYVIDEDEDRIYGRGTADMKGAVAAQLLAFRDAHPPNALVFASFVGEETGGRGARHAIDTGFAPEYAIVGEGSTNYSGTAVTDVAVAHKGRRGSTLITHGVAAHASEPEAGENAVYAACEAIDWIRRIEPPHTSVFGHEMEGSLAITEIEGGSAWNVIPDRCEMTLDERTVPSEKAPLEELAEQTRVEWRVDQDLPPMRCTDDSFARSVQEAAQTVGVDARLVTKPHATDAGWLAQAGVACVICGPAEPGEAHTATESVSTTALERCYRIYREAAESVT